MVYLPTEIAEMVCTRMSHDLGGGIGAISSSLELLAENNNVLDNETLQLITIATNTLKSRQQFFRVAFGSNGKVTEGTDLQKLCDNYLETIGSRNFPFKLKINGLSAELAKIICLCIMTLSEVAIKGGDISVDINKNNITLKISSDYKLAATKIADYAKIINKEKLSDNLPQYVALIYLQDLLGNGASFKISSSETEMTLVIA